LTMARQSAPTEEVPQSAARCSSAILLTGSPSRRHRRLALPKNHQLLQATTAHNHMRQIVHPSFAYQRQPDLGPTESHLARTPIEWALQRPIETIRRTFVELLPSLSSSSLADLQWEMWDSMAPSGHEQLKGRAASEPSHRRPNHCRHRGGDRFAHLPLAPLARLGRSRCNGAELLSSEKSH